VAPGLDVRAHEGWGTLLVEVKKNVVPANVVTRGQRSCLQRIVVNSLGVVGTGTAGTSTRRPLS